MFTRVRHTTDGVLRPIAGDSSPGSANGCSLQVRNTLAHLPVPTTRPVEDQSGGAPAASGGEPTANGDSTGELRSGHTSGCLGNYMLPVTHPSDAERLRLPEQCCRRSPAAALMAIPRSSRPGQPKHARKIKMEPTRSTDAAHERNWAAVYTPAPEKKNTICGRKRNSSKLAPVCTNESKSSEAKASPKQRGAGGARIREGGAPGYRLRQSSEARQWRRQ